MGTPVKAHRTECLTCHYQLDPADQSQLVSFPCNVRVFRAESFQVWRCPRCQTIHCLEVVDLDDYYVKYPIAGAVLNWAHEVGYHTLLSRFTQHGLKRHHKILDYGCGGNGLFVQYLHKKGYRQAYGYDPYGAVDRFGDPATLQKGPFDYILCQDVVEHLEDPHQLLQQLDSLLASNGSILIGTPNAAHIDLSCPHVSDQYNQVHVPYHLHLYTREVVEQFGQQQGWKPVTFYNRGYDDTPWFGFNTRAWNAYVQTRDGMLDVIYEPINLMHLLTSSKFLFNAIFGYWLSFQTDMAIMFSKDCEFNKT